jgi:glycosyltransferase involved in cell wall biosynthesis
MSTRPWLTVITVVKDATADFTLTANSLAAQDLTGVEYLVIDSSTDREAVPGVLRGIESLSVAAVHWVEPAGIYAAMNAGLTLANGDYCYFANAGDVLFSDDTLARVRASLTGAGFGAGAGAGAGADAPASTWAFGPVEILSQDGTRVITPSWDYAHEKRTCFSSGHFPCHQGTFASTSALRSFGGFDTSYSIVADYVAFLRLSQVSDPIELDFVIATFAEGGISTTRWQESFRQFHAARVSILRPSGAMAIRERWNTASQYAKVFVVRNVLRRGRA